MHDEDLCFRSATDLAADIRSRRLSPVELARAVVARIEALNPALNCFCTPTPEIALDQAKAAASAASVIGHERRPAHVFDEAVGEDVIRSAGFPSAAGRSREAVTEDHCAPRRPTRGAVGSQRLRQVARQLQRTRSEMRFHSIWRAGLRSDLAH